MATFNPSEFLTTLIALGTAFVLGTAIGFERQFRQRTAGLRTNVLVALGAAAFADLGIRLYGFDGGTRIIAYIVSGVGFLGAGVIMKDGTNIRGLNTAATLWCSAAVGAFSGSGLVAEAVLLTCFVLAGNTFLRPLVNYINRSPIDETLTEAEYRVIVTCDPTDASDVRDLMSDELEKRSYPIREIEVVLEAEDHIELSATLIPTAVSAKDLDAVAAHLEKNPLIRNATWTVSTSA